MHVLLRFLCFFFVEISSLFSNTPSKVAWNPIAGVFYIYFCDAAQTLSFVPDLVPVHSTDAFVDVKKKKTFTVNPEIFVLVKFSYFCTDTWLY